MQYMTRASVRMVANIECDRCHLTFEQGDKMFEAMVCVDYQAGYTSPFGDGNRVQLDFCEDCFRDLLSPWIRVKFSSEVCPSPTDRTPPVTSSGWERSVVSFGVEDRFAAGAVIRFAEIETLKQPLDVSRDLTLFAQLCSSCDAQ